MRIAILALTLLGTGCILPGDLREIQFAQQEHASKVSSRLDMLEGGTITAAQAREQIDAAQDELDEKYDRKVEEIAARTQAAMAAVEAAGKGDFIGLTELLAGLAATGVATGYSVMKVRDQRYKKADGAA